MKTRVRVGMTEALYIHHDGTATRWSMQPVPTGGGNPTLVMRKCQQQDVAGRDLRQKEEVGTKYETRATITK